MKGSMNVRIITPAPPRSRTGNRVTALRWARVLGRLGHRVKLAGAYRDDPGTYLRTLNTFAT